MWFLGVSVTFTGRVSLANTAAGRIQTLAQDNEMKYIIEMFLLASAHKKRSLSLASQTEKLPAGNGDLLRIT